jgi:hypothetical protein
MGSTDFGTVQVRRERGRLVVQGFGRTDRGRKYLKATSVIDSPNIGEPGFKGALATSVKIIFGVDGSETPLSVNLPKTGV